MIQSGDDDWIINSIPSGRRSNPLDGYGTYYEARIERTETFLFGGLSPPNKKITSLRPRRLCGENPILDKPHKE